MHKRIREIDARLAELRQQLRSEGDVDMDAIEKEITELQGERAKLMRCIELAERADVGSLPGLRSIERSDNPPEGERKNRNAGFAEPAEYRDAWAARMLGLDLTTEQMRAFERTNAEYRAFTHTTENTAVLIPETVVAGIWKRVEEAYPLWNDVRKFNVRGALVMKRFKGKKAGGAAWYKEADTVQDTEYTFDEIRLTGCELAISVTVSWMMREMSISDFIPFIVDEISKNLKEQLGYCVYAGKGKPGNEGSFKPELHGIKTYLEAEEGTPQVVTYASGSLKESDIRSAVAKLHSSHIRDAKIYVSNATAWTVLAGVQDGNKRPIFLNDVSVQGAVGRVFGLPVKIDASIGEGEILIGNPGAGYWTNVNRAMSLHTEDHVKDRETDYMGYAIVDGDVYDSKAFALLKPGA